ncbi:MAG: fibronectin type III domain-containing protein [Eggerthella lenta]
MPGESAAYRVAYRPADGGDDAWVEQNVDAGSGDIVTCQASGLQASTAYEWRVCTVVSLSGGELTSDWSDTQTFLTLSDSGLTKAVVAPALVRYDTASGGDVSFRVLTDASDATGLGYRWQRAAAGGDDWQDVTVGDHFAVDGDKLTVKAVFASTTEANGTKYRCVVSAGGNGAASVTKESTAGRLWHRVAAPTELAVGDTSLNGAELSWKGSPDYEGTFTLDYRAVGKEGGDGSWTTVEGIERDGEGNGSYALTGLDAATFYEWRVTFVTAAGGVSSETAVGSTFSTLEGSRLTSATVTPRAAVADEGDEVEFAVSTNVDGDAAETMVRDWQTLRGATNGRARERAGRRCR